MIAAGTSPGTAPGTAPGTSAGTVLRAAGPADVAVIAGFVAALAAFENLAREATASEADFHEALFGPRPRAAALIAETAGSPVGFALWTFNFSTFTGRPGLYVEDVYVEPAWRGQGVGQAIFRHLARLAVAEGCARMEWSVLDWNENALRFYRALGARGMEEWTLQRLSGPELAALAT